MTDYDWSNLRAEAITKFGGQTPGAPLEQRIINVFQHHPALVAQAIDKIAAKHANGTVRSPWPVLALDIEDATTPVRQLHATDSTEREHATMRAEQWIRATGIHYDRWDETHDELFGDRGPLRAWKNDQTLVARMRTAWDAARPTGLAIDRETEERAHAWRDRDRRVRHATRPAALRLVQPPPAFVALANGQPAAPAPEPGVIRR